MIASIKKEGKGFVGAGKNPGGQYCTVFAVVN